MTKLINNKEFATVTNKALAGVRVKRWAEYSKETKEALVSAIKPSQKGGKVIEVQPACPSLGQINKGTKRDKLIQLGLEGAFSDAFTEFASAGFWKGAYSDPAGGYGYVIEEVAEEGGKPKKFCYYVLPASVTGIVYREKKEKVKKVNATEKDSKEFGKAKTAIVKK